MIATLRINFVLTLLLPGAVAATGDKTISKSEFEDK